ncbi:MFS transporter [Paraburkholderia antibiotica]|uniref:MFS transporter n=1 Tax=Paraburkholderia antibiotica TaxID=2728839 RepID=A0A7X9X370_9BURK|nr:MFS transporter [Paraburkholderia antibiotica]NML30587.1 MFS transporter [Paraburkholderia antibiotica]
MTQATVGGHRRWVIVAMLTAFMLINFCDKAVFGIAAPSIMRDLGLGPAQFGTLGGSFFYLFSLALILFGKLAERISPKKLLLVCAFIWTVAQLPIAFGASISLLYASRILLGFGEGPSAPLCNHAAFTWFENKERNLPSTFVSLGAFAGLLVSGPLLTHIIVEYDWHRAYLVLSLASLAWGVIWIFVGQDGPYSSLNIKSSAAAILRARYFQLFFNRTFLSAAFVIWTSYFAFSLIFSWVPSYMRAVLHFGDSATGWAFMLFSFLGMPILLVTSLTSQRLQMRGVSSKRARGWMNCGLLMLSGVLTVGALMLPLAPMVRAGILAVAWNLPQVSFVLAVAIVAEITPDSQRSTLLCALSAIGTTAGLIAPAMTGHFLEGAAGVEAGYHSAFEIAGALLIVSSLVGFWLIDPEASKRQILLEARDDKQQGNTETVLSSQA